MKDETEHSPLVQKINNSSSLLFFLILLFLPTQLGLHFWPSFAYVSGQRIDYLSPTLFLTDIFIVLLFLLQGFWFVKSLRLWFIPLIGVAVATILVSKSPLAGWYELLKIFEFVFLGWFVATHAQETIDFLKITLGIGIVIESVLAIWQFILQGSVGGLWYLLGERTFSASTPGIANASLYGSLVMRPYGTFSHPNVLAGFLLVGLVFLATVFRKAEKWKKILIRGVVLLGSITLCLTLSRTAIVLGIVMLGMLLFHIVAFKTRKYQLQVIGGSLLVLSILVLFLFPRFVGVNITGESVVLREELLQASWQMFISHPVMGVGLQNFLVNLPAVAPRLPIQPVHNIFMLVLSETGIVGFLLFIYMLGKTILHVWSSSFESQFMKNNRIFVLVGLFIFVTVGLVDHYFFTLQQGQLLTTLLFGLSWAREKN